MGALIEESEARSAIVSKRLDTFPIVPHCQSAGGLAHAGRCCRHNQASSPECPGPQRQSEPGMSAFG